MFGVSLEEEGWSREGEFDKGGGSKGFLMI